MYVPCILYRASCTLYLVPCILYRASCTVHLVPCILYRVSCTVHLVPCILYRVSCTVHLVPCILYRASCTVYLAPCILYRVSCTVHLVPCILYRESCTVYLVPCILYRVSCTVHLVPYILYSLLSRPTDTQHIYVNNVLYFLSTLCASNCHTVYQAHNTAPQDHSQPQPAHPGRTPYAVGHGLILLMMGILMPETCSDRKFDNKHLVGSVSLHPTLYTP